MARIPDIERRLLNWARWKSGEGGAGLGYGSGSMWNTASTRTTYREATVPTFDVDASATDVAITALPGELRASVEALYLRSGTIEKAARLLCCAEATLYRRVDQAHIKLAAWFSDRDRAAREEAARVQRAIASARP